MIAFAFCIFVAFLIPTPYHGLQIFTDEGGIWSAMAPSFERSGPPRRACVGYPSGVGQRNAFGASGYCALCAGSLRPIPPSGRRGARLFRKPQRSCGSTIFTEPKWPKWLLERGLLEKTTVFARGCLVLWWPQPEAPSLDLLRRGTVAVPDPEITGYGMLAKVYLDREGLWQQGLASRRILVLSSGPQTVTAVESGTVQSALMSLTLVRKLSGGFSLVPGASIDQVVGVAPGAGPEARRFAEFLCSENARALLEQGGFVVPQAPEERP